MLLFTALFVGSLSIAAYLLYKHNIWRKLCVAAQLPGPRAYPLIGNGLLFCNKSAIENFNTLAQLIRDYGDILRIWVGPDLNIFLSNPKDVEYILSSPQIIAKAGEYKFIRPWLSDGLLLSKGNKWSQRRKILTPAFHFKILEQFVEIFDRQANTMMETLSRFDVDDKVELHQIGSLYALDVICETAMGTSINAQQNSKSEYVLAVKEMSNIIHLRMFDIALRVDFLFEFSGLYTQMRSALRVLHGFTDKVIRERRAELMHSNNPQATLGDNADIGAKPKSTFLDILLQARINDKPFTDLDIREEVDTFMFEGHDTTTAAMTFVYYNIAKYPDVQRKCFEEIRSVIGSTMHKKPLTLQDLSNLPYLELVIKEAMRMYPPVPLIGREILEETTINGHTYPAQCNLLVPIYSMGRNETLFENPHEFRPERFAVNQSDGKFKPFSYIPFSAGPRNCIGQKFAMLELKSVISKTLRHFEISLDTDSCGEPQLIAEMIMVPASRINFHLKPRKYETMYNTQ